MKEYTLYCHISPSKKIYFGITCQEINKRWENGRGYKECPRFYGAIKKYGWENIEHIVLKTGLSKEEAEKEEMRLISEFQTTDKEKGYNIENGGNVPGTHSEETRRKISEGNKGRIVSEMTKAKRKETIIKNGGFGGARNSFYNKKHKQETKDAQRERMKNNTFFKGHHHTEEFKAAKSKQMKEIYKNGSALRKAVISENIAGEITGRFRSLRQAAESINRSPSYLCMAIKNQKIINNMKWRYESE